MCATCVIFDHPGINREKPGGEPAPAGRYGTKLKFVCKLLIGTIVGPEYPHNFAFGDDDGKTLYLCVKTGLYRIRLNIQEIRP